MGVNFGRIFGRAFRYPFRRDVFFLLFAVQVIFGVSTWFVVGYFTEGMGGLEAFGRIVSFIAYLIPLIILNWVVMIFLMGAYFENSAFFYRGKEKGIFESLRIAKERFFPLLLTLVIIILVLLACFGGPLFLVILLPSLAMQTGSSLPVAILVGGLIWLLTGAVIGAVVFFMTFLAPVSCVIDRLGPLESIRKSWALIRRNKLNTFLFLLIFFVIYTAISMIGSVPDIIPLLMGSELPMLSLQSFSLTIFRTFFNVYLFLFTYSSNVNFYLAVRRRGLFRS